MYWQTQDSVANMANFLKIPLVVVPVLNHGKCSQEMGVAQNLKKLIGCLNIYFVGLWLSWADSTIRAGLQAWHLANDAHSRHKSNAKNLNEKAC